MNASNSAKGAVVTMERTFKAPVKLVWEAWTNPDHVSQWWGPPGIETKILAHDFGAGGNWQYGMQMPDGNEFLSEGTYKEIVQFEKIITSADFKPMTEGVELQVLFEDKGATTRLIFKVIHSSEAYRIEQEKMGIYNGWGSVFERLGSFLSG